MLKKERNKILILYFTSIVLGITLPFSNIPYFLVLCFVFIVIGLVSLVIIIAGLFTNRLLIRKGIIGLFAVSLFLIVGIGFETLIRNQKHKIALEIVNKIEEYKVKNKKYPNVFDEISQTKELRGFRYFLNDSLQQFRIEYLMDGFNRKYYDSKNKYWGTLGWND